MGAHQRDAALSVGSRVHSGDRCRRGLHDDDGVLDTDVVIPVGAAADDHRRALTLDGAVPVLVGTPAVARSHWALGLTPLLAGSAALATPLCCRPRDARLPPDLSPSYGLTMQLTCVVASVLR